MKVKDLTGNDVDVQGIPISVLWLCFFGFTVKARPEYYEATMEGYVYALSGKNGEEWNFKDMAAGELLQEIKYVHELQNLWRIATGAPLGQFARMTEGSLGCNPCPIKREFIPMDISDLYWASTGNRLKFPVFNIVDNWHPLRDGKYIIGWDPAMPISLHIEKPLHHGTIPDYLAPNKSAGNIPQFVILLAVHAVEDKQTPSLFKKIGELSGGPVVDNDITIAMRRERITGFIEYEWLPEPRLTEKGKARLQELVNKK